MKFLKIALYSTIFFLAGASTSRILKLKHHKNTIYSCDEQKFPIDKLIDLTEITPGAIDKSLEQDTLVLFFFNTLSCTTCVSEELKNSLNLYEKYKETTSFCLVYEGNDSQYLYNLIRVGKVNFPVLMNNSNNALGFSKTTIAVIDVKTESLLTCYKPTAKIALEGGIRPIEKILNDLHQKRSRRSP